MALNKIQLEIMLQINSWNYGRVVSYLSFSLLLKYKDKLYFSCLFRTHSVITQLAKFMTDIRCCVIVGGHGTSLKVCFQLVCRSQISIWFKLEPLSFFPCVFENCYYQRCSQYFSLWTHEIFSDVFSFLTF